MWPDRRLIELLGIELPIVQAPVAGAMDWLAAEAAEAGALRRFLADVRGAGGVARTRAAGWRAD